MNDPASALPPARPCPICGKAVETAAKHKPFCSPRCATLDLGKWLKGDYAIPAVEPPDDFDPEAEDGEGEGRGEGRGER